MGSGGKVTVMSRGPGRIARAIGDIFDAHCDNAFTTEEFCEQVYPGVSVEKEPRICVIRASKNLALRRAEIDYMTGDGVGRQFVFYWRDSVNSYAWRASNRMVGTAVTICACLTTKVEAELCRSLD